ncbi:MAG: HlyD family efflux transporter periplasmic adaptor subunit [Pseudomonadota bacterium]
MTEKDPGPDTSGDDDLPLEVVDRTAPPAQARRDRSPRRRLLLVPTVMLLLATGGIIGLYFQPPSLQAFFRTFGLAPGGGSSSPIALPADVVLPEDVAATLQPTDVVGLARILPRGDVSPVAPPFGAGDARLAELKVSTGARVAQGDLLALLDNEAALQSAVLAAEANVALQEANLARTRQSVSLSIAEAEATLDEAAAAADVAAQDLVRVRALFDRGVATQSALDQAAAAARQSQQSRERAAATLARYEAGDLSAQNDVIVAERTLEAARIEADRARLDLARAQVTAPISGTVLAIDAQVGQSVGGQTLMRIGDTSRMMAEVEVYQDRIADIALGQPVEVLADAVGLALEGEVSEIGLEVERQEIVSDDTAAATDARIVRVLVTLTPESSELASRYTGLEVIARIDTRDAAPQ